jgi:hypothetical protein
MVLVRFFLSFLCLRDLVTACASSFCGGRDEREGGGQSADRAALA